MPHRSTHRVPGIWQGFRWALQPGAEGGGTSRARLGWRALRATLGYGKALPCASVARSARQTSRGREVPPPSVPRRMAQRTPSQMPGTCFEDLCAMGHLNTVSTPV